MKQLFVALSWFAASFAAAQPASAPVGGRFDGAWLVTLVCPNNTEKSAARGYRRQFVAQVKDSALRGESLTETSPGWIRIEGRIGADGSALLDAHGRTGDPEFAVSHPAQSSPYAYHVDAHFDAAHGSGRRIEQRVCSFEFERR
jgi:hypothetical protein